MTSDELQKYLHSLSERVRKAARKDSRFKTSSDFKDGVKLITDLIDSDRATIIKSSDELKVFGIDRL